LGVRHFRGGARKLIGPEAEGSLFEFFRSYALPQMRGDPVIHKSVFMQFYETWNVEPDDQPPELPADTRERLEEHYVADAERLAELGIEAPWAETWR
jgi:hypothetical protein